MNIPKPVNIIGLVAIRSNAFRLINWIPIDFYAPIANSMEDATFFHVRDPFFFNRYTILEIEFKSRFQLLKNNFVKSILNRNRNCNFIIRLIQYFRYNFKII